MSDTEPTPGPWIQEDSTLEDFEEKYVVNLWKCRHRLLRRWIADEPIMK